MVIVFRFIPKSSFLNTIPLKIIKKSGPAALYTFILYLLIDIVTKHNCHLKGIKHSDCDDEDENKFYGALINYILPISSFLFIVIGLKLPNTSLFHTFPKKTITPLSVSMVLYFLILFIKNEFFFNDIYQNQFINN